MDKIVSVDKPKYKKSRWDLYVLHYIDKNGHEYTAHVFEEEYDVRIFKEYLFENGISEIDLSKYEELLYKQWERESVKDES